MVKFPKWFRSKTRNAKSILRHLESSSDAVSKPVRLYMDGAKESRATNQLAKVEDVVTAFRQALLTFPKKKNTEGVFESNLRKLRTIVNKLRADDLGLDQAYSDPNTWKSRHKAPCTYIELYQNDEVILNTFVLRPGFKMPLHDHPHMHGLLKVILGSARIRSFTEITDENEINMLRNKIKEDENWLKNSMHSLTAENEKKKRLFARVVNDRVYCSDSEACSLTPILSNFHEIEALDEGPVAFFDILSPPYETPIEGNGPRKCRYFKVNEICNDIVELVEISPPTSFYCEQAPYLGPPLL